MKGKKVPQHVMKVFEDEVKRFLSLDEMSSESNMIRSYLESIASIPFGVIQKTILAIIFSITGTYRGRI